MPKKRGVGSGSSSYFLDPKLVPRIRERVEEIQRRAPLTADDVDEMSNPSKICLFLRARHPAYARKPQAALLRSVTKGAVRLTLVCLAHFALRIVWRVAMAGALLISCSARARTRFTHLSHSRCSHGIAAH